MSAVIQYMRRTIKVSIIIPVYNEEKTIRTVINAVQKVNYTILGLSATPELVIVDDCSSDSTYDIVSSLKKKNIKIIRHRRNMGKGAAIASGLAKVSGDLIIIQDADLEYSPQDYPKLLKPLVGRKADVVYGNRMRLHVPPEFYISYLGNKTLTAFTNILFGSNLYDVFVGYKAFTLDSIKNADLKCKGFDIEIEMTAHFLKTKKRIVQVPIAYHGRTWKEGKKISIYDGLLSLVRIVQFRFGT